MATISSRPNTPNRAWTTPKRASGRRQDWGGPGGTAGSRTDPAVDYRLPTNLRWLCWALSANPETGRFPERLDADAYALALAEFVRLSTIRAAREQEVDPIVTNSDGNRDRRGFLLGLLGPGATERVIDPGRDVVTAAPERQRRQL